MRFLNLAFLLLFSTTSSYASHNVMDVEAPLPAAVQYIIDNWDNSRVWMKHGRVVICDAETTGIRPRYDRIVQVTLYEIVDGHFTGKTYNSYFNPHHYSSSGAYNAHRLGSYFLSQQPEFATEFPAIKAFIGDSIVVGHNVDFDMRMLEAEYKRLPGDEEWSVLSKCSLGMARRDDKRAALTDLTNPQLASIISPAPKVRRMKRVSAAERRRSNREYEAERRAVAWERERTMPVRSLGGRSQNEARDQRVIQRGIVRDRSQIEREDALIEQENSPPAPTDGDNVRPAKRTKSFALSACMERANTSPKRAVRAHGFVLNDLAAAAGVPLHRRGKLHDAYTDVAGTVGVFDFLSSSDYSNSSSQSNDEDDGDEEDAFSFSSLSPMRLFASPVDGDEEDEDSSDDDDGATQGYVPLRRNPLSFLR